MQSDFAVELIDVNIVDIKTKRYVRRLSSDCRLSILIIINK